MDATGKQLDTAFVADSAARERALHSTLVEAGLLIDPGTKWRLVPPIAWDTYDQGNYDVMARLLARGRLNEPIAVAASPRFEARPSIAVDANNRAWIAFEDAGDNWGKDYGTRWTGKSGAGMTIPGEMARVTGLPRPEAGLANRALVAEGYADSPAPGVYHLAKIGAVPRA